ILQRDTNQIKIIDPIDTPALNFFHFDDESAETTELFHYLFSAIDRELSSRMATAVTFILRLMRKVDDPSITTLKSIMESDDIHPAVSKVDPVARDFLL